MAAAETEQVVRRYFEELGDGRFDAPLRHYTPDAIATSHGQTPPLTREQFAQHLGKLRAAAPDLSLEVLDVAAGERHAAVRWRSRGTFTGPARFNGFLPTGAAFDFEGVDFIHVVDGAISRIDGYTDSATIARQLGLLPREGSVAERIATAVQNATTRAKRGFARSEARSIHRT